MRVTSVRMAFVALLSVLNAVVAMYYMAQKYKLSSAGFQVTALMQLGVMALAVFVFCYTPLSWRWRAVICLLGSCCHDDGLAADLGFTWAAGVLQTPLKYVSCGPWHRPRVA